MQIPFLPKAAKGGVAIGVIFMIIQAFLLIGSNWIFGAYAAQIQTQLFVYLLLMVVVMASLAAPSPTIVGETINESSVSVWNFILLFVLTSILVLPIPNQIAGSFDAIKLAVGFGLFYLGTKVYIEEIIFRDLLPKKAMLGDVWSNILFGIFHIAVNGVTVPIMFMLMGLGFIWSKVRDRFGLLGSMGSHLAWNLKANGVLEKIFGIVSST